VRVVYLPSSVGSSKLPINLTTLIVNDALAIDAGCLGYWKTPAQQARITDILITHSHLDHIGSLPMFASNVAGLLENPVRLHLSADSLDVIRTHLFNDRTWVNFDVILQREPRVFALEHLSAGESRRMAGLDVRTVAMTHPVPTLGVVLRDKRGSVAFSADTGPTEEFWEVCRHTQDLRGIFVECSLPNAMEELAIEWGHLTPNLLDRELSKIGRPVRVIVVHLKASKHEQIVEELKHVKACPFEVVVPGKQYAF
jgi:cAMP phosphodiesterase